MKKLKLFVWTEFCTDYTDGLAFALAEDETEARKLVIEEHGYDPGDSWGVLEVRCVDDKFAGSVSGGG